MNTPLLYRAALQGTFGKRTEFGRGSIADALFVSRELVSKWETGGSRPDRKMLETMA